MPFELFLALRYLRSRRKRKLARATAVAATAGIAVGVAALIVAVALTNGFREEMRDKILHGTAHLTVMRTDGLAMQNYTELAARIRQMGGVASATGTTYDGAVAAGPKGSAYAVIRGVDTTTASAGEIKTWIVEGSFEPLLEVPAQNSISPPNAIIGAELATRTGLHVGDRAELFPAMMDALSRSKRVVRIAGIFRSGLFEYDSAWIYLPLESAIAFTDNTHAASLISVQLTDLDNVKNVAGEIKSVLGNSYTVIDWQEANKPLFTALALERRVSLFIVGLIVFIATLNITTMLILVVVERRRDIAILNAMGASARSISGLFIIEGAVIGTLGAVSGVVMGLIACLIGNHYKLVSLPADVYSISSVPFRAHLSEVAIAVAIAFTLSVVATLYPARAAARMQPAETLRDAG